MKRNSVNSLGSCEISKEGSADSWRDTTIIIRWSATQDMPDKSPYLNRGIHIVSMRWGKIVNIDANEDSQLVAQALNVMAAYGLDEAVSLPFVS